jgi:hypothetical protein
MILPAILLPVSNGQKQLQGKLQLNLKMKAYM